MARSDGLDEWIGSQANDGGISLRHCAEDRRLLLSPLPDHLHCCAGSTLICGGTNPFATKIHSQPIRPTPSSSLMPTVLSLAGPI